MVADPAGTVKLASWSRLAVGCLTVVTTRKSQADKQVVLIDADLRRPKVHRKFGLHNRIGLTDLFVRPLDALSGIVKYVDVHGLAVITSGGLPPNPAELLTSQKMIDILDRLNQDFDIILIDTLRY